MRRRRFSRPQHGGAAGPWDRRPLAWVVGRHEAEKSRRPQLLGLLEAHFLEVLTHRRAATSRCHANRTAFLPHHALWGSYTARHPPVNARPGKRPKKTRARRPARAPGGTCRGGTRTQGTTTDALHEPARHGAGGAARRGTSRRGAVDAAPARGRLRVCGHSPSRKAAWSNGPWRATGPWSRPRRFPVHTVHDAHTGPLPPGSTAQAREWAATSPTMAQDVSQRSAGAVRIPSRTATASISMRYPGCARPLMNSSVFGGNGSLKKRFRTRRKAPRWLRSVR